MLRTRPQLGRRERWLVIGVAGVALALALVSIVSLSSSSSPTPARGCIYASVPGATGATEFRQCGAAARQLCASLGPREGLGPYGASVVGRACRKAGLPTRSIPART